MTPEQRTSLKAYIQGVPALAAMSTGPTTDFYGLMNALNVTHSPDFIVTKTALSRHDILTATSDEATTFAWAGGAYITRSQGERDAFREMFNSTGTVNPTLPSITAAFADIFSGAGGASNRTHVTAMSKRKATVAEKALASGTGTLVSPGTMTFEGVVSLSDVVEMFGV